LRAQMEEEARRKAEEEAAQAAAKLDFQLVIFALQVLVSIV